MKRRLWWNRERRENWDGAVENALTQLAMKGNDKAADILEQPLALRMLSNMLRFRPKVMRELGDGQLLENFERLVEFLLSKADEILALILKIIPLFVEKRDK